MNIIIKEEEEEFMIIPNKQCGFTEIHLMEDQVLRITDDAKINTKNQRTTYIVRFNIEKAFEKLCQDELTVKMKNIYACDIAKAATFAKPYLATTYLLREMEKQTKTWKIREDPAHGDKKKNKEGEVNQEPHSRKNVNRIKGRRELLKNTHCQET